jgi:hypothetical protein
MTKRKIEYWVIPPDADGEFVANMEVAWAIEQVEERERPMAHVIIQPGLS